MKKSVKLYFFICCLLLTSLNLFAQKAYFYSFKEVNAGTPFCPGKYESFKINTELNSFLWALPSEQNLIDYKSAPIMAFPMPDGQMARFYVWETLIMEPGLASRFPNFKTFRGQGIDDPYATIQFDFNSSFGLHAQILSVNENIYIEPELQSVDNYISYYSRDYQRQSNFICKVLESRLPDVSL